jgi:glycosyltransferase involved in cell wall biosynthesis
MRLLLFNLATDADDPILGFTTDWLNALAAHFQAVDVLTMRTGRLAVSSNVHVYSVGKERGYSEIRRAAEFYRILFARLRHEKYDACFAHMMPLFAVMGAPLLKLKRVPITLWYAHKATPPLLRLAEKMVDRVVTASAESFRIPSRKVTIIGHGIDTEKFVPAAQKSQRPFTVLSVSRIAPVKRLETLIEAARIANVPRVRLVGSTFPQDAAYAESLRRMVNENGLTDVVELVGAVNHADVAREYQNADVLVNLSDTGSMDKAVLEAMACAVPVITSNEAFYEMLSPYDLFLPQHDVPSLAEKLRALMIMNSSEREKLGESLRQIVVESHSLVKMTARLVELLARGRR